MEVKPMTLDSFKHNDKVPVAQEVTMHQVSTPYGNVRVYEGAIYPPFIAVGKMSDNAIVAVHCMKPSQLPGYSLGATAQAAAVEHYPTKVEFEAVAQSVQHAMVKSINDTPEWKDGAVVINPPHEYYVLFRATLGSVLGMGDCGVMLSYSA